MLINLSLVLLGATRTLYISYTFLRLKGFRAGFT
jgi:hypothetical protein